ncbi:MAG: dUTP diphosphatase [Proteobacteria bacterium]|nr:dUTP diphosphatase [Pseudomonadota bacterium]
MAASTTRPQVQIHKLRANAVLPRYMSRCAAGLDLSASIDESVVLAPGERRAVGTGLAVAIPDGYEAQVRPRSGLALETGITVLNAPGTIDSDYRGEVVVLLVNLGTRPVTIEAGQRIAQLVIAPVTRTDVVETTQLPPTERGAGGFGSTGQ